jgi:hypothetical protein
MKDNEMNQPLPKATPDLAKAVWGRQQSPSARSVARALTQSGRPVHFTTVNRWRGGEWRDAKGRHPLDQARAYLESALPLVTGDPTSTIDDLLRSSPEGEQLNKLSDGELLRKAARELARAVYLVAHMMLLQGAEKLWITRTAAVAVLMRALADSMRWVTTAFDQVRNMRSGRPDGAPENPATTTS